MYRMTWSVVLFPAAEIELRELPKDIGAKFQRVVGLIEQAGPQHLREPHVKHLEGRLWEMRMSGRDGIVRAIYPTAVGRRVVVLRVFAKKTQAVPRREIELALQRAKEVE